MVSRKTPKHALYVKAWEARRGTDPSLVKCRRVSATARDIDRRVPVGDNAADTRAGAPAALLPRPRPRRAVPTAYRCTYTRDKRTVRSQTLPPRRQVRVASRNSGSRRAGAARRRREINLTRDQRRFISPLPCSSLGAVLALFPHTLHHEVAALAADQPHLPNVSPGVEVQGVTADAFRTGPQVSARSEQSGNNACPAFDSADETWICCIGWFHSFFF